MGGKRFLSIGTHGPTAIAGIPLDGINILNVCIPKLDLRSPTSGMYLYQMNQPTHRILNCMHYSPFRGWIELWNGAVWQTSH